VAGLVLSGTSLYGTAEYGGFNGYGTIFRVDDTSLVFTNLHNFSALQTNRVQTYTNGDGAYPLGRLALSGNMLYGTASIGGTNGNGTIFAMATNGTGFTTLHHFSAFAEDQDYARTNSDGYNPSAGLVLTNNILYGVAQSGGVYGNGTVFAISTSGSGFAVLHAFARGSNDFSRVSYGTAYTNSDGINPSGDLVLEANLLYGTTSRGGTNGSGTVFSLSTNGAGFATLYTFTALNTNSSMDPMNPIYTNSDGAIPLGGLVNSSNVLYGTTWFGGLNSDGTVFSLSVLPQIGIVRSGTNIILTWPTNMPGFNMEFTTNLAPTANWVTNPTAPVILNGQYALTNSTSGRQKFYRLIQ
jgi:uncharacterized repeat protein (TIGR03803 family)